MEDGVGKGRVDVWADGEGEGLGVEGGDEELLAVE